MNKIEFSILITTKNRLEDLKITLQKIIDIKNRDIVEVMLYGLLVDLVDEDKLCGEAA